MWEYIVLGQVPGTQIQVSFETWLVVTTGVFACYVTYSLLRSFKAHRYALTRHLRQATHLFSQTAAYMLWLITRRHLQA